RDDSRGDREDHETGERRSKLESQETQHGTTSGDSVAMKRPGRAATSSRVAHGSGKIYHRMRFESRCPVARNRAFTRRGKHGVRITAMGSYLVHRAARRVASGSIATAGSIGLLVVAMALSAGCASVPSSPSAQNYPDVRSGASASWSDLDPWGRW